MGYQGLHILAVVPARGGSKSIPGKNLCQVGGISLVGRAAQVAKSLELIDKAVLSTDDEDIAKEGRRYGIDVPFMRPEALAGDLTTSVEMWRHAWIESERYYGMLFDLSILLEPTSPLRQNEDIKRTVNALTTGDHLAAATVSRAPAHFTPHKSLTVDQQGHIGFYLKDGAKYSLRQKIPTYYFRNGICYAAKRMAVVEKGQILEERCKAVVIDRPIVNIDEPFDLELAEFLLQKKKYGSHRL